MLKPLELTLAIIKPHVVANPLALSDVRHMILNAHFKIIKSARQHLSNDIASRFYEEHRNKFFYNRLVIFMTSGPLDVYILARHDAIQHWRNLMGPTKVYRTQYSNPNTIRGKYGLSDTRNASHGSDSLQSASSEIKFFFPNFNIPEWYKNEETLFRNNANLHFNEVNFIHEIKKNVSI